MKRKKPEPTDLPLFKRDGHRSHTRWARFVRNTSVQDMLVENERRLNELYVSPEFRPPKPEDPPAEE